MPSELMVNLRQRFSSLQQQDIASAREMAQVGISAASNGMSAKDCVDMGAFETLNAELRSQLNELLGNESMQTISEEKLMDANSLLTHIVMQQRNMTTEMRRALANKK